jgi:hypothetical protein
MNANCKTWSASLSIATREPDRRSHKENTAFRQRRFRSIKRVIDGINTVGREWRFRDSNLQGRRKCRFSAEEANACEHGSPAMISAPSNFMRT